MRDTRNIEGGIRDENILEGWIGMRSFQSLGCGIVLKMVGGMRDLNSKRPFENLTRWNREKDLNGRDGGMKPKLVAVCGLCKPYFGRSCLQQAMQASAPFS